MGESLHLFFAQNWLWHVKVLLTSAPSFIRHGPIPKPLPIDSSCLCLLSVSHSVITTIYSRMVEKLDFCLYIRSSRGCVLLEANLRIS
jgi:hypothetical protein